MTTIGWIFILCGILLVSRVVKGRALNIPEDFSDAFQALIRGDYDSLSAAFNRTGDSATYEQAATPITPTVGGVYDSVESQIQKTAGINLVYWAYQLGRAAKGYRFGATGPDYYDCSGLVYRAAQKVGYKGPRFFTGDIQVMPGFKKLASTGMGISQVQAGDVVVWPGKHMGVVTGANAFYSARSVKSGIKEGTITGFSSSLKPVYYRYTPPTQGG